MGCGHFHFFSAESYRFLSAGDSRWLFALAGRALPVLFYPCFDSLLGTTPNLSLPFLFQMLNEGSSQAYLPFRH